MLAHEPDLSLNDKLREMENLIDGLKEEIKNKGPHRNVFKNDTGYFPYADSENIDSGAMCWDGKSTKFYLSNTDALGNQWHGETAGHGVPNDSPLFGSIYSIQEDGKLAFASRFMYFGVYPDSHNIELRMATEISGDDVNLANKTDYVVNLGAWM